MDNVIVENINRFIASVKSEIKDTIKIEYTFDEQKNMFNIWHDCINFDNKQFKEIIGKNVRLYFFENDIFNISVAFERQLLKSVWTYYSVQNIPIFSEQTKFESMSESHSLNYRIENDVRFESIEKQLSFVEPESKCLTDALIVNCDYEDSLKGLAA